MHFPRVHYTQALNLGKVGRELALAILLSVASLCLGPSVVTSRAQAEVLETRTGWLERGCPGRPGRRVRLEVGQPQETEVVCPGVEANGFRSLVCRSSRASGGREERDSFCRILVISNNSNSNNSIGSLQSSISLQSRDCWSLI